MNGNGIKNFLRSFSLKRYDELCQLDIEANNSIVLQIFYAHAFRNIIEVSKKDEFVIQFDENYKEQVFKSLGISTVDVGNNRSIIFCKKDIQLMERHILSILSQIFSSKTSKMDFKFTLRCF